MSIQTFNDIVAQIGARNCRLQPVDGYLPSAMSGTAFGGAEATGSLARCGYTKAMPNPLPSGVTGYFCVGAHLNSSVVCWHLLCKIVNLGSFDISGSGTFTDGASMPTVTELGVSRSAVTPMIVEVTTPLSFGSTCTITVTYTDQDGNTGATTAATSLTTGWLLNQAGFIQLASGDSGLIDITGVTRGGTPTTPSGVITFWGVIPIAILGQPLASQPAVASVIGGGKFNLVPLGAGDTLTVFRIGSNSAGRTTGELLIVGDN